MNLSSRLATSSSLSKSGLSSYSSCTSAARSELHVSLSHLESSLLETSLHALALSLPRTHFPVPSVAAVAVVAVH